MMLDYNYPEERLEMLCLAFQEQSEELREAAEFEARVAKKLAELFSASAGTPGCPGCPCGDDCYSGHLKCKEAILKYARLAVEEEMENAEMDN